MTTVKHLDHVNIQCADVGATARFFTDVLELSARPMAPGVEMDAVTWMFDAGNRPIVHLNRPGVTFAEDSSRPLRPDTGALNHVAFECADHAAMLARLEALGIAYRCREIAAAGLKQVFVDEPNGVRLELNFRD